MNSRRLLKAAEAIREVVSISILTELRDPRIRDVTVTYVEVAPDMRSAKVHVSIMGSEARQNLSLRALQHAAGFLQQRLSERIITRYIPKLQFVLDKGVKNSLAVSRILREVLPPEGGRTESLDEQAPDSGQADSTVTPPPDAEFP
ncbi:MAG: ribosome-binding factor A [Pirellulaceae bacterium]|nr:MAG: ribosome-binding factor A [Pirellulaceae bacterium]GIW96523.1 MAG: ribosome-binding factor A [Pirellulaceae bacterium]